VKKLTALSVLVVLLLASIRPAAAAPWDGNVHAPLKTAQPKDWSAPDVFFTGSESGSVKYVWQSDSFEGTLELDGFNQAGPYVLSVDTADGTALAG